MDFSEPFTPLGLWHGDVLTPAGPLFFPNGPSLFGSVPQRADTFPLIFLPLAFGKHMFPCSLSVECCSPKIALSPYSPLHCKAAHWELSLDFSGTCKFLWPSILGTLQTLWVVLLKLLSLGKGEAPAYMPVSKMILLSSRPLQFVLCSS